MTRAKQRAQFTMLSSKSPSAFNVEPVVSPVTSSNSARLREFSIGMVDLKCSICDSPFDLEGEGGIHGFFGVCEVAFCVWCYASIIDMVESNCFQCQENLHHEE